MPLLHCKKCCHEWEGGAGSICDWCGAHGKVIQEETDLEKFFRVFDIQAWIRERYK